MVIMVYSQNLGKLFNDGLYAAPSFVKIPLAYCHLRTSAFRARPRVFVTNSLPSCSLGAQTAGSMKHIPCPERNGLRAWPTLRVSESYGKA